MHPSPPPTAPAAETGPASPVLPSHIDTSRHFWGAFNKTEREISARYIVRMCQEREAQGRGTWEPFTYEEIDGYYTDHGAADGFRFNGLDTEGFLRHDKATGLYHITRDFIARCYKASPTEPLPAADPEPQERVSHAGAREECRP